MKPRQQKARHKMMERSAVRERSKPKHDWRKFDALTDADIVRSARTDPDARPLSQRRLERMKRPNPKVVRQALSLSQAEFAERFKIPIGTLRDWEQGRAEPDQAACAYLMVIARNPKAVWKALVRAA